MATYHELMGFKNLPNGHWLKKDAEGRFTNQKQFVMMLGQKLGFTTPEHWYKISQKSIKDFGGDGLITKYYHRSPSQFVKAMFPEYAFRNWLFTASPWGNWNNLDNVKEFVEWLYHENNLVLWMIGIL